MKTQFVFSGANAISVADVDAGAAQISVTLNVSNGVLNLGGIVGITFAGGSNGSASMTITGTQANINNALNGMTYTPDLNFNGSDILTITTDDQGNTGTGGAQSDTDTVLINITAVNDAPINTVPGAQSTNEDTAIVFSGLNAIIITDVDLGAGDELVTLNVFHGILNLNGVVGLSFATGSNGSDSMSFSGTLAAINTALNGMTYTPDLNYNGSDVLVITTNDQGNTGSGGDLSDTNTISIQVDPVNDAPVNSVPGALSINEDTAIVFSGVNAITVADVDAGASNISVTLNVSHGLLNLGGTVGIGFTGGSNGSASMTITGTVTAINNALNNMTYSPDANYTGSDTLTITTNDQGNTGSGGALSDTNTIGITVNAANDPPINIVPGPQAIDVDTEIIFSGGKTISITDNDIGSGQALVTLNVSHGRLHLNGFIGLTFISGGDSSASMTFAGTLTDIMNALQGMHYTPDLNYIGQDALIISTNDQSGIGALSDTKTVNINVNPINPVNDIANTTFVINPLSYYNFDHEYRNIYTHRYEELFGNELNGPYANVIKWALGLPRLFVEFASVLGPLVNISEFHGVIFEGKIHGFVTISLSDSPEHENVEVQITGPISVVTPKNILFTTNNWQTPQIVFIEMALSDYSSDQVFNAKVVSDDQLYNNSDIQEILITKLEDLPVIDLLDNSGLTPTDGNMSNDQQGDNESNVSVGN